MAVIDGARIAAAHEGHAELGVSIRYSNGGRSDVPLGPVAAELLMRDCDANSLEQLHGQSWEKVQAALINSHKNPN